MVKIRWILTDTIDDVDLDGFDVQWNGIYGYFQIAINHQEIGFYPDRELFLDEEGDEDILYWLSNLSDGILQSKYGQKYEIQLLSMNRAKIILKQEDRLKFILANSDTSEVIWIEEIEVQELCSELVKNIERFIFEIQKQSCVLLESKSIKKLLKAKDMLSDYLAH